MVVTSKGDYGAMTDTQYYLKVGFEILGEKRKWLKDGYQYLITNNFNSYLESSSAKLTDFRVRWDL